MSTSISHVISSIAIVIALIYAFSGYNALKNNSNTTLNTAASQLKLAGILISIAVGIMFILALFLFVSYNSIAFQDLYRIVMIGSVIAAVLLITALVYSWIAYAKSHNQTTNNAALITAISLTVAVILGYVVPNINLITGGTRTYY